MAQKDQPALSEHVATVIKKHAATTKKFAVAVSGGADSVALLRLLCDLNYDCLVLHFDHQLRASSADDLSFVAELSDQLALPCVTKSVDVAAVAKEKKWNLEDAARRLRYDFLTKAAKANHCDLLLTAHTLDDQAETVFMQILRGTAFPKGMKLSKKTHMRPLLAVSKQELLEYLNLHQQPFRTDETNFQTARTRSWLRYELFPIIKERYPQFKQSLSRLAHVQQEQYEHFEKEASQFSHDIAISNLIKRDKAIQRHVIAQQLKTLGVAHDEKQISSILTMLLSPTPKRLSLSKDSVARVAYGRLSFLKLKPELREASAVVHVDQLPENVDAAKISLDGLVYRSRQAGDTMQLVTGTKKLSDLFIDRKVPRESRDSIAVLAKGSRVYWVKGIAVDPAVERIIPDIDNQMMQVALVMAQNAFDKGELPVGAVISRDNHVIAKAHNLTEARHNPTAHAELLAIHQASQHLGDWRLNSCTLYVTLEPCPMCFGAMLQAHLPRIVYAASNHREGALGSVEDLNALGWKRKLDVKSGVLASKAETLLETFFRKS